MISLIHSARETLRETLYAVGQNDVRREDRNLICLNPRTSGELWACGGAPALPYFYRCSIEARINRFLQDAYERKTLGDLYGYIPIIRDWDVETLAEQADGDVPLIDQKVILPLMISAQKVFGKEGDVKSLSSTALDPSYQFFVRANAVEEIGNIGSKTAADSLLNMLGMRYLDDKMRKEVINALGRMKERRAVIKIAELLITHPSPAVRCAAAGSLGDIGDIQAVPFLMAALEDKFDGVRSEAVQALGKFRDELVVYALLDRLDDECYDVKFNAALSLVKVAPHVINKEAVIAYLQDGDSLKVNKGQWENSTVSMVRAEIAKLLGLLKHPRIIEPLVKLLADEKEDVVKEAVISLRGIKDQRVLKPLVEFLKYRSPRLEYGAWAEAFIQAAGAVNDLGGTGQLLALLRNPRRASIHPMIERALADAGDPSTMKVMMASLRYATPEIRIAAARVLGKYKNRESEKALIAALKDGDWRVRREAALSLGEIGGERARSALMYVKNNGEKMVAVKIAVIKALDRLRRERS